MVTISEISKYYKSFYKQIHHLLSAQLYFGKSIGIVPGHSIVLFPVQDTHLFCGLAGLVAYKRDNKESNPVDLAGIAAMIRTIEENTLLGRTSQQQCFDENCLGGDELIEQVKKQSQDLKIGRNFAGIYLDKQIQAELADISSALRKIVQSEADFFTKNMGYLNTKEADIVTRRIETLKDIDWCLRMELIDNIKKVEGLLQTVQGAVPSKTIMIYRQINAVLNSIDRLEVRGRDSAGISLMFVLSGDEYARFNQLADQNKLVDMIATRMNQDALVNQGICINDLPKQNGGKHVAITMVYKVAAEIGALGDNIRYLRKQIESDPVLRIVTGLENINYTATSHTRWASVGEITQPNCHPVDNKTMDALFSQNNTIHICLNGDIDNYRELKEEYEKAGGKISKEITTDTKIIPIQIEKHLTAGNPIQEAFRLAVNDFHGSHAISMHTDLAPGKMFLAQKGSGQAVFIGIGPEHYMPTSEVYGFVEETSSFLKMDGEKVVEGKNGPTQGQIFILNQESAGGLDGIEGLYYDGTLITLNQDDIKHTEITSRDIDRQGFPHYFLKEISEAPVSVEKTMQNRWKIDKTDDQNMEVILDEKVIPKRVREAWTGNRIRRIFFIGQGTAGIAAQACANILDYYLNDPGVFISALKASELSGFKLSELDKGQTMEDSLVIAISQSGTTTDTNRAVDMVRERGGLTLAIVNRRDSHITFKVDGVLYTSSGRDIEMSVASTKAFYSQIVAGALLGLFFAKIKGNRDRNFITHEIKQLLNLPGAMKTVLGQKDRIGDSAKRLATTKTYWAAVGSGPNKASADEIRIKLSELCYKTISSDFVEDKKHIDLSSEPLIIVCAAGTRGNVIGDIVKDTAIFKAHKASPIVIADEGEDRFAPYAEDVFHVPAIQEHLAPVLNTLVGHIWGYYAALAINDGSRFLHQAREGIKQTIDECSNKGMDVYEVILEKSFKEKIATFYNEFRQKKSEKRFPGILGLTIASDLTLLLKYLTGRLPVSDFEIDFGKKGTALNMLNDFFRCMGEAINCMARPVDAIKHQAKTVTVGTSRISEKVEGILFDALSAHDINVSRLINRNVMVLKNLQGIVSEIKGSILYKIDNLSLLGDATDNTTITVMRKDGVLKPIPSRIETDNRLKGTKRIIVRQGNVYIGRGRKDDRSIIVIPIISDSPSAPNIIGNLLLLNIGFKEDVDLAAKTKALGGKYEHIQNIVQENSIEWDDRFLELVDMPVLFGSSAEKIGEYIIQKQKP